MKYNKAEIMKNAWSYFKSGECYSFSKALKRSWDDAKTVSATDLKTGDYISIEYGDYDNIVKCVVTEIEAELYRGKYMVIRAVSNNGLEIEFCPEPDERIFIIEPATIELSEAA